MDTPPPPVQMVQLLAGFQLSQALYAAAKVGIPDQLTSGPRTPEEVAGVLQTDQLATGRLLRALAGLGVFSDAGEGRYALTPLGETLVSDAPGSMRDLALMWMETHYEPFAGLVETVRTGRTAATEYYGRPFFEWLATDPDRVAQFSGAMANLTHGIKAGAIAAYDFGEPRRIVDLGGSDGAVLALVLGRIPQASGVVYDLPHVVGEVALVAKAHGLDDRLTAESGDFFERVPGDADLYLTSMILHDWDDARAARLLSNIAAVAPSGARLRAFELVVPRGDGPHMSKMIDLTMLGMLTGRERDEEEMCALVEGAGLRFDGVASTPTPMSVVEAHVP
jgi:O-methyltransferase domain/Dimerisation domain